MTGIRVSCGCGNEIHARIEWRTRGGVAVIRCPVCGATRNADVSTAEFWARYEARRRENESRSDPKEKRMIDYFKPGAN